MNGGSCADADVNRLWLMSRICEEFHCLPATGERLLLDDPEQDALEILSLRAYARAKSAYDAVNGEIDKLEKTPLMDQVIQNDYALHKERTT